MFLFISKLYPHNVKEVVEITIFECIRKYNPKEQDYPGKFVKYCRQYIRWRIVDHLRKEDNCSYNKAKELKDYEYVNNLFGKTNRLDLPVDRFIEPDNNDVLIDLYNAIEKLDYRNQLIIHELLEGNNQSTIAKKFNVSEARISSLMKKIIVRLKLELKDYKD